MSIEDKYNEVRELIIIGKERGYLLYDEIYDLLPEDICSPEELDSIFSLFGSVGIEVIDIEQEFSDEWKRDDKKDGAKKKTEILALSPWIKRIIRYVFTFEKWLLSLCSTERGKLRSPNGSSMDRKSF